MKPRIAAFQIRVRSAWDELPVQFCDWTERAQPAAETEQPRLQLLSKIRDGSFSTFESEGNVNTTGRGLQVLPAPGRYHHKLMSVDFVGNGRRVARKGKCGLPKQFAGEFIECTEFLVVICGTDKKQTTCCHHRPTIVFASRVLHPL